MKRRKLQTILHKRQKRISLSRKAWQLPCFLYGNCLISVLWHCLISPPSLYRLHFEEVLVLPYRLQPVSIQSSLRRRRMPWHLSDSSSFASNKYNATGHDDHGGHSPPAASTCAQPRLKIEDFPLFHLKQLRKSVLIAYKIGSLRVRCPTD